MHAFPSFDFPYSDKYLFMTLFLFINHMVKVIMYNPLSLIWIALMITKSGLLIFIYAENSYLVRQYIYPHYVE